MGGHCATALTVRKSTLSVRKAKTDPAATPKSTKAPAQEPCAASAVAVTAAMPRGDEKVRHREASINHITFLVRVVFPFEITHTILSFLLVAPPILWFQYYDRTCEHRWCHLTMSRCCHCQDRRRNKGIHDVYVDGKGFVTIEAPFWLNYCPGCKNHYQSDGVDAPSSSGS